MYDRKRSIAELAREALSVQDACNPLGLSKGYADALQDLADNLRAAGQPSDTKAICEHPINRLWLGKLCDLAQIGSETYGDAYRACKELSKGT